MIESGSRPLPVEIENKTINHFSLDPNYPNPFNPSNIIRYSLEKDGFVKLKIFDLLGCEVATLVNEYQTAGTHSVEFNTGISNTASSLYFYQLESGNFVQTRKMILLK